MPDLGQLEQACGVQFNDVDLLRQALAHRSYLYEHAEFRLESNERLEYLGDAVLTYVSSLHLFRAFPEVQEGQLTALRAAAVRAETLAKFARQIDLGTYLLLGRGEEKGGGRSRPLLLSSAFEALVGAILLDQGLDRASAFIQRFLEPEIEAIVIEGRHQNFKSRLQELTQAEMQATPEYRTVKASGPSHARTFTVEVLIKDEVAGRGEGANKRSAQQAAAREALLKLTGSEA